MKCCQRENPELLSVSQMIQQNLGRSTIPRQDGQSIPIRLGCTIIINEAVPCVARGVESFFDVVEPNNGLSDQSYRPETAS